MRNSNSQWTVIVGTAMTAVLLPLGAANGQTLASEDMEIVADVESTCIIDQEGVIRLDFGAYDPLSDDPRNESVDITVRCTAGTTFYVTLGGGDHEDGSGRRMQHETDPAQYLRYQLSHVDFGGTEWTENEHPAPLTSGSAQVNHDFRIYGQVPASQDSAVGRYTDTVLINVELQ